MNEEQQVDSEDKPVVELRSDKSEPLPDFNNDGKKKVWWIVGGVIAALLIISIALAYSLIVKTGAADKGANQDEKDGGLFGALPFADKKTQSDVSGLSGISCEHPNRRAVGVMLAGDTINRPISGFTKADMVWELPVLTSNVTRLMALYQCGEPNEIGSVRSARHDYLFLADGTDAILSHWGGSYHALNRIKAGEFQTINALTNPFKSFFRKDSLPRPYNGFTSYDRLWNALQKLGYRTTTEFKGYNFKDDIPMEDRISGGKLSIAWPGSFRVSYEYNPQTNRYERYWAGVKQIDVEDGKVVAPSSIVVMRASNKSADGPGGYNDVGIEGEGDITVYQDGKYIEGRWKKNELNKKDPMSFVNKQGDPIIFTRGQLWVMAPDNSINVTWKPVEASPTPDTSVEE